MPVLVSGVDNGTDHGTDHGTGAGINPPLKLTIARSRNVTQWVSVVHICMRTNGDGLGKEREREKAFEKAR